MDKIDAWLNRAFGDEKKSTSQTKNKKNNSNKAGDNKSKSFFSKKKFVKKPVKSDEKQNGVKKKQFKKHHNKKDGVKNVKNKHQYGNMGNQNNNNQNNQGKLQMPISRPTKKTKQFSPKLKDKLKVIPLGGLNEVGKNMMAFEYKNDIVIVDMGFEFPGEDMLGIDYVIPDVSYLETNRKKIRGVIITHGHLDHIGGINYILPKLDFPPVYATKLTLGLIGKRIDEFKQQKLVKLHEIDPNKTLFMGQFKCDFFRVMHSIPDSVAVVLETPAGKIVHTGDFKFDDTPARNLPKADIHKMEALGSQNVLALFCESTNALIPGHSMSEMEVGKVLEEVVLAAKTRLIVSTFSSQIGRIQQIIDAAVKANRKVYVSGRSMITNIDIASKLGFLSYPAGTVQDIKKYKNAPDRHSLILTTGSQGEPVSALTRMANGEHPHVRVKKGDTIVFSSSPIIGNERGIYNVINNLTILGAKVIHNKMMDVHTSGHGKRDELEKMVNYIKPKYLVPIHGEYFMRQALGELAVEKCGISKENVIMLHNGDVLVADNGLVEKSKETIETKYILIDGEGEGHQGSNVAFEREMMAQNGVLNLIITVNKKSRKLKRTPDVISKGFMYMHESKTITDAVAKIAEEAYRKIIAKDAKAERKDVKMYVKQSVDKYTRKNLGRRPLIVPILVEV